MSSFLRAAPLADSHLGRQNFSLTTTRTLNSAHSQESLGRTWSAQLGRHLGLRPGGLSRGLSSLRMLFEAGKFGTICYRQLISQRTGDVLLPPAFPSAAGSVRKGLRRLGRWHARSSSAIVLAERRLGASLHLALDLGRLGPSLLLSQCILLSFPMGKLRLGGLRELSQSTWAEVGCAVSGLVALSPSLPELCPSLSSSQAPGSSPMQQRLPG